MTKKKITNIKVISAGSMPDVDTDFHTKGRAEVYNRNARKYGEDAVANIITFNTYGAKKSFKDMCTIYEKNYQASNKISSLIPDPFDGEAMSLSDIFNPEHERYEEAADFRARVSDDEWKEVLEGAMSLEGRIRESGVHACGVIMAGQSLEGVLPTQVRQDDGRVISQWTYSDCEAIGLIKMDLLGLDTIDLIQKTLEYIERSGKEVPVIEEIIEGDMKDPKTINLLREARTVGVFQLGESGVRDLLRRVKPDSVEDIIATTALYRPGPMGMNSHIKFANRKNGLEEIEPLHPDFKGSILDEILSSTYSLIVYQEQILKIANQIGGMSLQEGDKLRKAMGKKQLDVMDKMKPKFFDGGTKKGFSKEALQVLWDTMVPFAKYAFNRAHSASYAINAYLTAYLKANFPTEFMAAAIAGTMDNNNKKEKKLELMRETHRMGLKLGPVDANQSDIEVAPALSKGSKYDIVLGFSGIKSVSRQAAQAIVSERESNGKYESPENFIKRNMKNSISTKSVYESLALAGAFDGFGYTRSSIVESVPHVLSQEKKTQTKGDSLFDLVGISIESNSSMSTDLETEYSFSDRLKLEADMCGMYVSAHPLDNAGKGLRYAGRTKIDDLLNDNKNSWISKSRNARVRIIGAVTDISAKTTKSGAKRYLFTVDDGTGYIEIMATGDIAESFSKQNIINAAESKREAEGTLKLPLDMFVTDKKQKELLNSSIVPVPEPEKNDVYILECTANKRGGEGVSVKLVDIKPLRMDKHGKLPARVKLTSSWIADPSKLKSTLKEIVSNHPGDTELWVGDASMIETERILSGEELDIRYKDTKMKVNTSDAFIRNMQDTFTVDLFDLGISPNNNI